MKKSQLKTRDYYHWFKNNFTLLLILLLFLYIFFAFLAPILMHMGFSKGGTFLYSLYSNFCHQLAYRSWFLFGEQSFYPIIGNESGGIKSQSDVFGISPGNMQASRQIIGDDTFGYKVAICQRDVMIYFMLMVFSIVFQFFHYKIKKIPFWMWFLFAVIPIGVDGLWQLISTLNLINIPFHESTPLIRSITGAFFGLFSGWYLLPAIQDTFKDGDEDTLISMCEEKQ